MVRWASLPGDLELPYVEQGEREGIPTVFLHAYADSWRSFELLFHHLPRSIRAIAFTQRGHGDAGRPASGYSVSDFAGDLASFMDAVGLDRAVLVASSSATFTAQRFAVDHPSRVLGLVLVGVPWSLRDRVVSPLVNAVFELTDPVDPAFVRDFVSSTVHGPVPSEFVEMLIAESLLLPARVWQAALQGLVEAIPPAETEAIAVPTLAIWGDQDVYVSRSEQERLVASIPDSRLLVYEGAGHVVHWEEPERVARDVVAFARGLTT